ncbi:MAG: mannose-1-phosphate guanylyltransferase [Candidatus Zixiibacteriota bacterium]|nr:MAG: mannose-1-phosphate guanylyltransferase [candidate division Zixibacteria bacterium]
MVYGVIMAGGRGERFWPLSRMDRPKQFLRLTSERTMLDETVERVKPMIPLDNIRIVTGETMGRIAIETAEYLTLDHILSEPFGRNTCLAVGLPAIHLHQSDPEAIMVVLSADHLIRPVEKLLQILDDGCRIAGRDDVLITIGIVPTRPETGYGYIKLGDEYSFDGKNSVYRVSAFTEKPKAAVAQEYYFSRRHLWNAGMFIWSAKSILSAFEKHCNGLYQNLIDYSKHIGADDELEARRVLYEKTESISIDYAVLEKADNVLTIKADIVWDDVGSWTALERYKDRDSENNVTMGEAILHEVFETTVVNDAEGLVACVGVSDLVIVRSGDITLVVHKTQVDRIKELLTRLEEDEKARKYL